MSYFTQRERDALDRYITGNYGEDQFRGMAEDEEYPGEAADIEAWLENMPGMPGANGETVAELRARLAALRPDVERDYGPAPSVDAPSPAMHTDADGEPLEYVWQRLEHADGTAGATHDIGGEG